MSRHNLIKKKSSTNSTKRRSRLPLSQTLLRNASLRSTTHKDLDTFDIEHGYPEPCPPPHRKKDIFNADDFTDVESHIRQAPPGTENSYQSLMEYILQNVKSDVAKVRAVFFWVTLQKIPLLLCQRDVPPVDTPSGYLHLIREKKGSYSKMFADLCRKANVPCVVINGMAKSIAYDVGCKIDAKRLVNSWNAVYVEGGWRLVHPYWAAMSAQGYNSGRWSVVECPDFHEDLQPDGNTSRSYILHTMVNDFFFLTDPDQFITKCLPESRKWQLLPKPISKSEFEQLPFLQPTFYLLDLQLLNQHSCVVHSENGKADIQIQMPSESHIRLIFIYKLYRLRDNQDEGEYEYFHLDRFVLHHCRGCTAFFQVRFPPVAVGEYKLELHCRDPLLRLVSEWICDFHIICDEGMEECTPLPVVPSIGWGVGPELAKYNVESETVTDGVVSIDKSLISEFVFTRDENVNMHAEILHNTLSKSELLKCIKQEDRNNNKTVIRIKPPVEGEYALQLFCKKKNGVMYDNVCNFLLQRHKVVETKSKVELRERLINAMEGGASIEIEKLLEEFARKGMQDRGDITKVKRKFLKSRFDKEIHEAMATKNLDKLEKLMQNLSDTSLKTSLNTRLVEDAEALLSRLRKLKRLRKAVLDMDAKSISEIRSYPKPPQAVHGVMAATFILLGNKEMDLQKWQKVQGLISKKGKDGLKRRVAALDASKIKQHAINRAKFILEKYDMESVQIASAGAATFYQWATTMIHDAETSIQAPDKPTE